LNRRAAGTDVGLVGIGVLLVGVGGFVVVVGLGVVVVALVVVVVCVALATTVTLSTNRLRLQYNDDLPWLAKPTPMVCEPAGMTIGVV
jgi:hypothetical protein